MFKMIATDLDGTLLNDESKIPVNNLIYIKKAIESGLRIAISSGRVFVSLEQYEKELGLNKPGNYGICLNGSLVYDTYSKEILRDVRIDKETAAFLTEELKKFPLEMLVYVKDKLYFEKESELSSGYAKKSMLEPVYLNSFDELKEDYSKILVMGKNEDLVVVAAHMRPLIKCRCNMFFSSSVFLEFTNMDANKGEAVKFLAGHVGLDISEIIAVGDHFNDIPMIKAAGLGIAVQNAEPEVKAAAGYVTRSNNNEGVFQEIVEKYILTEQ